MRFTKSKYTWNNQALCSHDYDDLQGTKSLETHLLTPMNEVYQFGDKDETRQTNRDSIQYSAGLLNPKVPVVHVTVL